MSKDLVRVVGSIGQDNLIAHIEPRTATTGIYIKAGAGNVARGTVLARDTDGSYGVYGGASNTEPSIILVEPVDASGTEKVAAVGYRAGCFNRNALIFADGYTMTNGDVDTLRKYGIILSDMLD